MLTNTTWSTYHSNLTVENQDKTNMKTINVSFFYQIDVLELLDSSQQSH